MSFRIPVIEILFIWRAHPEDAPGGRITYRQSPSKCVTKAELQLPLRVLGRNLSEVTVVGINVQSAACYAAPIRMVEPVEHLEPQRGKLFLRGVKILEQP